MSGRGTATLPCQDLVPGYVDYLDMLLTCFRYPRLPTLILDSPGLSYTNVTLSREATSLLDVASVSNTFLRSYQLFLGNRCIVEGSFRLDFRSIHRLEMKIN